MTVLRHTSWIGAVSLAWLCAFCPGSQAQIPNPSTTGIDVCNNVGTRPAVRRLPSYNIATGEVELPLVFAPGLGWYRAMLEPSGPGGSFRLKAVVPTCEDHPSPATYVASSGEVYIPEIEAIGAEGVVGKYDATLTYNPASGLFAISRVWDFQPGLPTAFSSRALVQNAGAQNAKAAGVPVSAVQLAQPTGPYAGGDRIPLTRTQGGHVSPGESGCVPPHLHGTITIDGSGPYPDPNQTGCGHGIIVTVDSAAPTSVVPVTVPPGTELCGPDITEAFFARLRLMSQRLAALPSNEKGVFDGTVFLARNGVNMDFSVGTIRDPQGNPVCPTPACSGVGHTSTFTLCGRCMMSHIDNDIEFGFMARSLGVPWSVQVTGGQVWDLWTRGSADPTWSDAAYWFGNYLADAITDRPDTPTVDLCSLLDVRLRIGLVFLPKVSELIAAGLDSFGKSSCQPCIYGCPDVLVNKDFAAQSWDLDNGQKANPPP